MTTLSFTHDLPFRRSTPRRPRALGLSPSTYPGARLPLHRTRHSSLTNHFLPNAVFLPPDGIPPIPDSPEDFDQDKTDPSDHDRESSTSSDVTPEDTPPARNTSSARAPAQKYDSIDRILEETKPDYETWVERNNRRVLSTFRGGSQWTLGADELNESLKAGYLERHRQVLAPDEAFGVIFAWEVLVKNSRELEKLCWERVAEEEEWLAPDMDDIVRAEEMAPEAAISRVFYWTQDWGDIKRCVFRKMEVFKELEPDFQYVLGKGVVGWLEMMNRYGVKCILCASRRTRNRAVEIVDSLGLGNYITKNDIVSIEDEFESLEQMLLVASLKASRPPGKCVVFTDKPSGITAGHEVSAKVVAVMGAHPAYEMKTADQIVENLGELVVYNIRRLFSEEGMEFMDPQSELEMEVK